MKGFRLNTEILMIDTVEEFIQNFKPNQKDIILTNEVIYHPILSQFKLSCRVIFQEKYGAGEPSDEMINQIISALGPAEYDRIFAIGGGTVIDISKVLALKTPKNVLDLLYNRVPLEKKHYLIVLPTTCGTGSEVTNIAILEDIKGKNKKGIVGPEMFPDQAVLVPELLISLPYKFFAFSSVDALIHGIESYLSPNSNEITELFAINGIERILTAYQSIAEKGESTYQDHIRPVLLASTLSGIAFGNTGVGAVHAMSYPLGGTYHVAHGEANYAFLFVVLQKYDQCHPEGKIKELKKIIGKVLGENDLNQVMTRLAELLEKVIILRPLREYGVREEDLPIFVEGTLAQERLLRNNYVSLSGDDFLEMLKERY